MKKIETNSVSALMSLVNLSIIILSTICLAAFAGDETSLSGGQSDLLFDPGRLERLTLSMAPSDWEAVRQGVDRWYTATVIYGNEPPLMGVGIKARSRRGLPRNYTYPNFHLDFAYSLPDQGLLGQRWLTTESWAQDDPTLIAQKIGEKLMRDFGLPAARSAHVKLYVNETYIGPYVIMDRPRREMLARFFDDPWNGNFYKLGNSFGLRNNDAFLVDDQDPDNPDAYYDFAAIQSPDADGMDIVAVVRALNAPPQEIRERLSRVFDIDNLIDYLAVDMSLADTDGLVAYDYVPPNVVYFQNNCYFYNDPVSNRFHLVVDNSLKGAFSAYDPNSVNRNLTDGWNQFVITRWMLRDPEIMAQYYARVRRLMNQFYVMDGPSGLITQINQTENLLAQAVREDLDRGLIDPPFTYQDWLGKVQALRVYVNQRRANVLQQLP